jgi:hypothetical protein
VQFLITKKQGKERMSHRVYIYNISRPEEARQSNYMLTEWAYDVPLLLQPLFTDNGFISGNIYNTHTDPENYGLYYNAREGIKNLKLFYEFLERHHSEMIDDLEKYQSAKQSLFEFLGKLKQQYFHIDAWDVFNMSDQGHLQQAQELLKNIAINNVVITRAIENDDVSLLNISLFNKESVLGFSDFKSLFNYPDYDYGLKHIFDLEVDGNDQADDEVEHFEMNGLWGLKDAKGRVLVEPIYEEFYGFAGENLAVIFKDEKYGFINKSGKIHIDLVYQDAFDFEGGRAVVKLGGKYGLINVQNVVTAPFEFDEIISLDDEGNFTARKDDKWGVIDSEGKTILKFDFEKCIEDGNGYFHSAISGKRNRIIFNRHLKYIGEFPVSAIEDLGEGYLLINPHKDSNYCMLFGRDGAMLEKGFERIIRQTNFPNALIIRKAKKYGVLGLQQQRVILSYEYEALTDLLAYRNQKTTDFILAQKESRKGVFDGNSENPNWVIPLDDYQDIIWLNEDCFAVQKVGKWRISNISENWYSEYEFDAVSRKIAVCGFAYAFKGSEVFIVDKNDIYSADKEMVLEDIQDRYSDYYFNAEIIARLKVYIKN